MMRLATCSGLASVARLIAAASLVASAIAGSPSPYPKQHLTFRRRGDKARVVSRLVMTDTALARAVSMRYT